MNEEIYQEILKEEDEEVYNPRPRKIEKEVTHTSDVGRLVYEIIGKNAPPLFYAHCNRFVSDMFMDGWAWWTVESKLKDALRWVKEKRAGHASLRTVLTKIRLNSK